MADLDVLGWFVVGLSAFLIGISKTGIPGTTILAVPLMAFVAGARQSVGLLLGILILADIFAAVYYHRAAKWRHLLRLLPAAFAGILAGYFGLKFISNEQLRPFIGGVVLIMLGLNYLRQTKGFGSNVPSKWWFAGAMGLVAGVTTVMANAAGPVMVMYFLAMGLDKEEFIGTRAWFFFIINWVKVPFMANLDLMTVETIKVNLICLPIVACGAFLGIFILKRINQGAFKKAVQVLAAAAAVKLLF